MVIQQSSSFWTIKTSRLQKKVLATLLALSLNNLTLMVLTPSTKSTVQNRKEKSKSGWLRSEGRLSKASWRPWNCAVLFVDVWTLNCVIREIQDVTTPGNVYFAGHPVQSVLRFVCKTSFTIYICNQGVLTPKEKENMLNMSQGEHGPQQELARSKLFLCAWAGGCALIELSTDLSGLLTPSLHKNNNDSSRKSHWMCKITVRPCSMSSKHKHQVSKAIYITYSPLFISHSNCFFFISQREDAHQKLPLGNYSLP